MLCLRLADIFGRKEWDYFKGKITEIEKNSKNKLDNCTDTNKDLRSVTSLELTY